VRARRHSSGCRSAQSKSALARLALAGTVLALLKYYTTVATAWPPRALSAAVPREGSGSNVSTVEYYSAGMPSACPSAPA
jgi:hypothetical protein